MMKPTFLRVGIPHNTVRPPTQVRPPTESAGAPTVPEGCTSYAAGGTSHDWVIPPNALPGDLVLAFLNIDKASSGNEVDTVPTGWTLLGSGGSGATVGRAYVYARVMDGSENYNDSWTTTVSAVVSAQWFYVKDYAGTVGGVDFIGSTASTTDPPAVTASVAGEHWVFAVLMGNKGQPTGGQAAAAAGVPSGYTFQCYTGHLQTSANNPRVYSARRLVDIATSEDPGAFNYDDGGAGGRFFYLATIAVPAGAFEPEIPLGVNVYDDGVLVGRYQSVDFRDGTGASFSVVEDGSDSTQVDVTVDASGGGGGTVPEWVEYLAARQDDETADADDDFFDDDTKTGYTELTVSGTATWTEARGRMAIKATQGQTGSASVALKSITASGPPLSIETAVMPDLRGEDFFLYGLCFTDGVVAGSNVVSVGMLARGSGANNIQVNTGTLNNCLATNRVTFVNTAGNHRGLTYFRLVQTAANTWAANYSTNGVTWFDMLLAPFSFTMTPTHFGPFTGNHNANSVPLMASWEYLRMNESNLDV